MNACYRCWAEVDLDALRGNLAWLRHRVGVGVKILTVVKADAYGHGLKQIAALLMQSGTDLFGVANLQEALAIRSVGRGWPILMLGACLPGEVETLVRDGVMPTISTTNEAKRFSAAARKAAKTVSVHVKVDTGLGRLGAPPGQALELLRQIRRLPGLELAGLYTHFAAVEDDAEFTRRQAGRFRHLLQQLDRDGIRVPLIHANNSAGLLHEPETIYNLVRPGLLVYGVVPPGKRRPVSTLPQKLRSALSLHCRVSLIKEVPSGTPLSYGGTLVTNRRKRVATLTPAYGDGYLRAGSNRARVLIGGRRCRVLGRITMDQMLVELPRALAVRPGDAVVLIGCQGQEEITANQLADWCRTVPWEVLTNITYRVPRLYRGGQAA
jgi:alanine racemase